MTKFKVSDEQLAHEAVELAADLLRNAARIETRSQRKHRERMARMLDDDQSRRFTLELADEVLRIDDPERAAARFRELVADGLPPFLGRADRLLLRGGALASMVLPQVVMPMVASRVRKETEAVLLPVEEPSLRGRVEAHHTEFIHMNLNLLGEAILGEDEARARVADVIALLERPHVDYVSVKISAICSQLDVLAFDQSVERIVDRLRELYRAAKQTTPAKFVNLDMEEYRDLHLTVEAFKTALCEDEFHQIDAGIVLQAYLPDSYEVLLDLCDWAAARRESGGGRIKVRIVKGANLAMEIVDAEMHGWAQAPFDNKADVDANFKRMLDVALRPQYADAVRIGVASHNLFDVAWALTLRKHHAAEDRLEVEMLEGMAPPQSSAVAAAAGGLLLYGPATRQDDLDPAVAYLARRLDENAAPDNFLHSLFSMEVGGEAWEAEKAKFLRAVDDRHLPAALPRRRGGAADRLTPPHPTLFDESDHGIPPVFANEPDTDFTTEVNRRWIEDRLAHWEPPALPATTPTVADVDAAVTRARAASTAWAARPRAARAKILREVAEVMAHERGVTIATTAHTAAKTVGEGDVEVSEAIDFARYYASSAHSLDDIEKRGARFDPYRVTVVASPWNFPYAIPAGGVLAALAAGSSVILKPAPQTRHVAALVVDHCVRGGVPADVVQLLTCDDDDAGRHLITHDGVDAVVLTGAWDTARLFRGWKPKLRLHAETSGKNAIVVTAAADVDAAMRDIVRSAFGHAGQKCSAASLAIVEASVYDDPRFLTRLADVVRSVRVGEATDLDTTMGPLIGPPNETLLRAFTTLDDGEEWVVEPRRIDESRWTPGVKKGVRAESWFHTAECFGPVLGVMRADSLDHAIKLQNATPFGLTAGLHSLDPSEVEYWIDRVDAGNLYVNRGITGAVVQRQPFGGWKRSAFGPTNIAKAGGPNYVATLGRWVTEGERANDFNHAWVEHFAVTHDPSQLRSESNDFRYVPYDRPVIVRVGDGADAQQIEWAKQAARAAGVTAIVSRDSETNLIAKIQSMKPSKVRLVGTASDALYAKCDECGIPIDDAPVTPVGRIELLHWVREQVVTETQHRYGNLRRPS